MWNTLVVNPLVQFLLFLTEAIQSIGIPYAFGFAIVILTILLKVLTYPLSVKQIRAMRAQQALQPKLAELQKKYGKDRERMSQEQMKLYREAGVNPLGGCLPLLVQMPILWGIFSALRHPALQVISDPGFFIIKNLLCPGPTCTIEGWPSGIGWVWPLPPAVGWDVALGYLPLPILLIGTQLLMQRFTTMSTPGADGQARTMNTMSMVFSLLFGYYTLILPASLSLYYIMFNILQMAQQYFATRSTTTPASRSSDLSKRLAASLSNINGRSEGLEVAEVVSNNDRDDDSESTAKSARRTRRKRRKQR